VLKKIIQSIFFFGDKILIVELHKISRMTRKASKKIQVSKEFKKW